MTTSINKVVGHAFSDPFEEFLDQVDKSCRLLSGLGREEIPDFDYAEAFWAGQDPYDTAVDALLAAGWTGDEWDCLDEWEEYSVV